jgi:hypothetical protein
MRSAAAWKVSMLDRHIDQRVSCVGRDRPMQPCRDVARLPDHEISCRLPVSEHGILIARWHFEQIDQLAILAFAPGLRRAEETDDALELSVAGQLANVSPAGRRLPSASTMHQLKRSTQ